MERLYGGDPDAVFTEAHVISPYRKNYEKKPKVCICTLDFKLTKVIYCVDEGLCVIMCTLIHGYEMSHIQTKLALFVQTR